MGTNYDDAYKSASWKVAKVVGAFLFFLLLLGILIGVLCAAGCSVLYRADGTPVPAVVFGEGEAGELGQFLNSAADFLPPPFNYLAGGAITLLLGGGGAAIARRRAEQAKREADAAWDESQRTAELAQAKRDAAFDEGTQRAAPVASVVAAVPAGAPAGVVPVPTQST